MASKSRLRGEATQAVAAELRAERSRRKLTDSSLTQKRMADESGIPLDTIKSIETGRSAIDVDQLFALADCLSIRPSEIVARAERALGGGQVIAFPPRPSVGPPTVTEEDLIGEPSVAEPLAKNDVEGDEEPEGP